MTGIIAIIVFAVILAAIILVPYLAVKARDKELEEMKRRYEERELNFDEFKAELKRLYKEEFAILDGNSYFEDPFTMDRVASMASNGAKIKKLKARFPQYEGQYDEDELREKARYDYGRDVLYLMNE